MTRKKLLACLLAAVLLLCVPAPAFAEEFHSETEVVTPPPPNAAPASPKRLAASIDWAGAVDAAWELLFTGTGQRSVDIRQYKIPYTKQNKEYMNYLFSFFWYTPRFLRIAPTTISSSGGYLTKLNNTGTQATDPVENRAKYDACMAAMDELLTGVKGNTSLSGMEKCLLLHDRLAAWAGYSYDEYLAGTISEDDYSAYGPLALHKGVCNGYVLAYNWMLEEAGIDAWYTFSETLNHGWSLVELDGERYYIDVTWDDPVYDIPGRVLHEHFLQSYQTFSAGHDGTTDYVSALVTNDAQTMTSTIYENGFYSGVESEIVRIGTTWYYFDPNGRLIAREQNGDSSVVQAVQIEADNLFFSPKLIAACSKILYLTPYSVRKYDTVTGEDTLIFTPSDALFPTDRCFLNGLRQQDGTVYVTSTDDDNCGEFNSSTVADYTEAFAYCGHTYTAQTVKQEALQTAATCTEPGVYYYSCSFCGKVEKDDAHTFSGSALGHAWDDGVVTLEPTTEAPGIRTYTCTVCAATRTEEIPQLTPIQPGDINGDGTVNSKDLTRLMKYLAGEDVSVEVSVLDVNGDGTVNNKDLTRLMKYLAGEDVAIF